MLKFCFFQQIALMLLSFICVNYLCRRCLQRMPWTVHHRLAQILSL